MHSVTISSSNWILMSCQPHRFTSGQSNSGHKQIHSSKLFSHISTLCQVNLQNQHISTLCQVNLQNQHMSTLCQVNLQNQSLRKHKTHTQTSDTNFRRVSPFNITPVKRAHKAKTCWYRRPFRLIYRYQVKEKYEKRMDRHNIKLKMLYKCIIANTSAIWQQAAHTTYQLSSPSCSTRAIQKKPNT